MMTCFAWLESPNWIASSKPQKSAQSSYITGAVWGVNGGQDM